MEVGNIGILLIVEIVDIVEVEDVQAVLVPGDGLIIVDSPELSIPAGSTGLWEDSDEVTLLVPPLPAVIRGRITGDAAVINAGKVDLNTWQDPPPVTVHALIVFPVLIYCLRRERPAGFRWCSVHVHSDDRGRVLYVPEGIHVDDVDDPCAIRVPTQWLCIFKPPVSIVI